MAGACCDKRHKITKKRIVDNSFFPSAIAIDPTVENFARVGVKGFARLLLEGCQPNRSEREGCVEKARMDREFCARIERAFKTGDENRQAAATTHGTISTRPR